MRGRRRVAVPRRLRYRRVRVQWRVGEGRPQDRPRGRRQDQDDHRRQPDGADGPDRDHRQADRGCLYAYFKSLNARGGINGWKVKVTSRDTQYIPQDHVRAFNEIRGDIALLSSTGAPTTKAIQQSLDQEKLVTQPISFDTVWGLDPVLAPLGTPYAIEVTNAIDYQVKENGGEGKKIGMVYQNDEFGKDGLRGYTAVLKDLGVKSVGEFPYKAGDTDFTSQVQKLKSAGADIVMCTVSAPSLASLVGTASSQGYNPVFIGQSLAFSPAIITDDGTQQGKKTPAADVLTKNTFTAAFATPASKITQAEGYKQLKADTDKYAPANKSLQPYYVFAYANAKVAEAIFRKAIESGDLSRDGILNAKKNLGTVDLQGLAADVTYGPEPAPPSRDSAISKLSFDEEGFLEVISESYTSETGKNFDITTIEE